MYSESLVHALLPFEGLVESICIFILKNPLSILCGICFHDIDFFSYPLKVPFILCNFSLFYVFKRFAVIYVIYEIPPQVCSKIKD